MELFKKTLVAVVVAGTMANGLNAAPSLQGVRQVAGNVAGYVYQNPRYAAAGLLTAAGSVLAYDTAVQGGNGAENVTTALLSTAALVGATVLVVPSLGAKLVAAVKAAPGATKNALVALWAMVPRFRAAPVAAPARYNLRSRQA